MAEFEVKMGFSAIRSVEVLALQKTSFFDRFLIGIFPLEREMDLYSSKPLVILAIKDMPEETRD